MAHDTRHKSLKSQRFGIITQKRKLNTITKTKIQKKNNMR